MGNRTEREREGEKEKEREQWIQKKEEALQEVGKLKVSLIEQREELNNRMSKINAKKEI